MGVALVAVASAWWWSRSPDSSGAASPLAPEAREPVALTGSPDLAADSSSSDATPTGPSLDSAVPREEAPGIENRVVYKSSVDFLSEFWGEKWPELREELERLHPERLAMHETLELTADLVPPPLASIHEEIVRRLLEEYDDPTTRRGILFDARADPWPEVLTKEFLLRRVGVGFPRYTDQQLRDVQELSDSFNETMRDVQDVFLAQARIDVEIEARAKGYVAWPLVYVGDGISAATGGEPPPTLDRSSKPSISLLISVNGLWIVSLRIQLDTRPHLVDLWTQLEEYGQERERQVGAILNGQ